MWINRLLMPYYFEGLASMIAFMYTLAIFSDAAFSTNFVKPLLFVYMFIGLYLMCVLLELIDILKGDSVSDDKIVK